MRALSAKLRDAVTLPRHFSIIPRWKQHERIEGAEPKRALGVTLSLLAASVPVESPGEDVGGGDAGRGGVRLGHPGQGRGDVAIMVEIEECGL